MMGLALWIASNVLVAAVSVFVGWHWHRTELANRKAASEWLGGVRDQEDASQSAVHRGRPPAWTPPPGWPTRQVRSAPVRQAATVTLPALTQTLPTAAVAGRPPWGAARRPPGARNAQAAVQTPPAPRPPDGPTPIEAAALAAVQARQDTPPSSSPPPPGDDDGIGADTAGALLNAETVGFLRRLALDDQLYRSSMGLPPGRLSEARLA